VLLAAAVGCAATGCASGGAAAPDPTAIAYADELDVDFSRMERTSAGLWFEELAPGMGDTARRGDVVRIHYIGYLPDGTVVDSSLGRDPLTFELGTREVIRGWNEGIEGMKVGARRKLVIRPGLAYGSRGREGSVPPDSVLVFEIQLLDAHGGSRGRTMNSEPQGWEPER
jgi:peptidylprolyl isomerase